MEALDGNAVGGLLQQVFGAETTAASSTCSACGASSLMAQLAVYRQAPGTVVRCRACGSVLMVFVQARGMTCVNLAGLASFSRTVPAYPTERDTGEISMPNEQTERIRER